MKEQIRNASESDQLDFKKQVEDSKKGHADFVKDVAAFSNYGGGIIIYGVAGKSRDGIPAEKHRDYDAANLHNKIKEYLSPVPTIEMEIIEVDDLYFPVLFIAKTEETAVIASKAINDENNKQLLRPGEIYMRQNTQSAVITNAAVFQRLTDRIVASELKRQLSIKDSVLENILSAVGKNDAVNTPSAIVQSHPTQTIDWEKFADREIKLNASIPSFVIELVPESGIQIDPDKFRYACGLDLETSGESYPLLGIFYDFCKVSPVKNGYIALSNFGDEQPWRAATALNFNGCFSTRFNLIEDAVYKKRVLIIGSTLRRLAMIWAHAKRYAELVGPGTTWCINIKVSGIADRKITRENEGLPFLKPKKSLEDNFEYEKKAVAIDDLDAAKEAFLTAEALFRLFSISLSEMDHQQMRQLVTSFRFRDASIFFT